VPILNHLDLSDDQLMGPAQMGTGGEAAEISCPTFPLRSNHNRRMRRTRNHCLRVRLAGPLFIAAIRDVCCRTSSAGLVKLAFLCKAFVQFTGMFDVIFKFAALLG
jgi:hypothetical protein